jgi:hypothetical protein
MSKHEPTDELQLLRETLAEVRQFNSRLMTGYEAAHRRVADHSDTLAAQNAELNRIAAKALEMQVKLVAEHEEMLSRRHERDIAATLAKQKAEAWGAMARDARVVGTLAVKRLAGIPITGNDSHGLQDVLASLTGEQIDSAMTTGKLQLTESQRAAIGQIFASLAEGEKAQAAE